MYNSKYSVILGNVGSCSDRFLSTGYSKPFWFDEMGERGIFFERSYDSNLDPKFYVTFLHFFRSSGWNIEKLNMQWIKLVTESVEIQKVDGLNILMPANVRCGKV